MGRKDINRLSVTERTYFLFKNVPNCKIVSDHAKITADGDCNHEIKRCLLLGRKVMTNLDSIIKSRDIILPQRSI